MSTGIADRMADRPSKLREYVGREQNRPLGGLKLQSSAADFAASQVMNDAAENLPVKVLRDLVKGNVSVAGLYIEKAA